ncbi:MAG: dihydrodipicolinate synthase family protein [Alicyclobacillus sp.]|nr:dihydrodipicolinate synthase family protein [Alicyclobacillus sp.]
MQALAGVSVIALTPFTADGDVDIASLQRLTEFYIQSGVHGITVLGIMGEFQKLTEGERQCVAETVIQQVAGRVPVVVGCSAPGTHQAVQFARQAEQAGASAVMVAPPQQARQLDWVMAHYERIGEAVSLPIVVQDEPTTTGVVLPPSFFATVAERVPTACYAKLEEPPTTVKITRILAATAGRMKLFGGLGGMYFFEELARGAVGIMTGFAYPEVLVRVYELFTRGEHSAARQVFYRYLPLIRFEAQLGVTGVAIRKETYKLRGILASAYVRPPAPGVDAGTLAELQDIVQFLGLSNGLVEGEGCV